MCADTNKNIRELIINKAAKIRTFKTEIRLEFILNSTYSDLVTYDAKIVEPDRYDIVQHGIKFNKWDKWVSIGGDHYYFYGEQDVVLKNFIPEDSENKKATNQSIAMDKYIKLFESSPDFIIPKGNLTFIRYVNLEKLDKFPMFVGNLTYDVDIVVDNKSYLVKEANIKGNGKLGDGRPINFAWVQKFSNYNSDIAIKEPKITAKKDVPSKVLRYLPSKQNSKRRNDINQ